MQFAKLKYKLNNDFHKKSLFSYHNAYVRSVLISSYKLVFSKYNGALRCCVNVGGQKMSSVCRESVKRQFTV